MDGVKVKVISFDEVKALPDGTMVWVESIYPTPNEFLGIKQGLHIKNTEGDIHWALAADFRELCTAYEWIESPGYFRVLGYDKSNQPDYTSVRDVVIVDRKLYDAMRSMLKELEYTKNTGRVGSAIYKFCPICGIPNNAATHYKECALESLLRDI